MTSGFTLIDLGKLSKPATVLIEKVSAAIGVLYEPVQIKRIARAEAEADKIKALAGIEVNEIQQRAIRRLVYEEGRRQENMEKITAAAAEQLGNEAKPERMDPDWISGFYEKCRNVSDAEMQSLWSKLLAGEATIPGSYSKRTVALVASLEKADAELFTRLCSFAAMGGGAMPLVFDHNADIYKNEGIDFVALTHLEAIGLIRFDSLQRFCIQTSSERGYFDYHGRRIGVKFKVQGGNRVLEAGHVMFTQAGLQLFPISGARPVPGFVEYAVQRLNALGQEASILA
jgi:hypothetical protein